MPNTIQHVNQLRNYINAVLNTKEISDQICNNFYWALNQVDIHSLENQDAIDAINCVLKINKEPSHFCNLLIKPDDKVRTLFRKVTVAIQSEGYNSNHHHIWVKNRLDLMRSIENSTVILNLFPNECHNLIHEIYMAPQGINSAALNSENYRIHDIIQFLRFAVILPILTEQQHPYLPEENLFAALDAIYDHLKGNQALNDIYLQQFRQICNAPLINSNIPSELLQSIKNLLPGATSHNAQTTHSGLENKFEQYFDYLIDTNQPNSSLKNIIKSKNMTIDFGNPNIFGQEVDVVIKKGNTVVCAIQIDGNKYHAVKIGEKIIPSNKTKIRDAFFMQNGIPTRLLADKDVSYVRAQEIVREIILLDYFSSATSNFITFKKRNTVEPIDYCDSTSRDLLDKNKSEKDVQSFIQFCEVYDTTIQTYLEKFCNYNNTTKQYNISLDNLAKLISVDESKKRYTAILEKKATLEQNIKQDEAEVANKEQEEKGIIQSISEFETNITTLTSAIQNATLAPEIRSQIEKACSDIMEKITTAESAIKEAESIIKKSKGKRTTTKQKSELDKSKKAIDTYKETIKNLKRELEEAKNRLEITINAESQIAELNLLKTKRIASIKRQHDLKTQIGEKKKSIEKYRNESKELTEKVDQIQKCTLPKQELINFFYAEEIQAIFNLDRTCDDINREMLLAMDEANSIHKLYTDGYKDIQTFIQDLEKKRALEASLESQSKNMAQSGWMKHVSNKRKREEEPASVHEQNPANLMPQFLAFGENMKGHPLSNSAPAKFEFNNPHLALSGNHSLSNSIEHGFVNMSVDSPINKRLKRD